MVWMSSFPTHHHSGLHFPPFSRQVRWETVRAADLPPMFLRSSLLHLHHTHCSATPAARLPICTGFEAPVFDWFRTRLSSAWWGPAFPWSAFAACFQGLSASFSVPDYCTSLPVADSAYRTYLPWLSPGKMTCMLSPTTRFHNPSTVPVSN